MESLSLYHLLCLCIYLSNNYINYCPISLRLIICCSIARSIGCSGWKIAQVHHLSWNLNAKAIFGSLEVMLMLASFNLLFKLFNGVQNTFRRIHNLKYF